ncbi:MAG: hypothetical protein IT292_02195 [Deltaproteobacteria bacterium]|nr:hypothetical protein [Deltaproteobacteria bacterium]
MQILGNLARRQKRLSYWLKFFTLANLANNIADGSDLKANLHTYGLLLARQAKAISRAEDTEIAENELRLQELDRYFENEIENARLALHDDNKPNFSIYYE